jgi:hypothetical protein
MSEEFTLAADSEFSVVVARTEARTSVEGRRGCGRSATMHGEAHSWYHSSGNWPFGFHTCEKANEVLCVADFIYPGFFDCEATIADLLEGDLEFSTDSSSRADDGGETSPSSTIAFALTSFP